MIILESSCCTLKQLTKYKLNWLSVLKFSTVETQGKKLNQDRSKLARNIHNSVLI